jgi:hypothetical protein
MITAEILPKSDFPPLLPEQYQRSLAGKHRYKKHAWQRMRNMRKPLHGSLGSGYPHAI